MVVRSCVTLGPRSRRDRCLLLRLLILAAAVILPTLSDAASLYGGPGRGIAPAVDNSFPSPTLSDPSLSFAFSWKPVDPWQTIETQSDDPMANSFANETISNASGEQSPSEESGAQLAAETAPGGGINAACEDDLEANRLQAAAQGKWQAQTLSPVPGQLPTLGAFTGGTLGMAGFTGLAPIPKKESYVPSGFEFHLIQLGPSGAWCRPHPLPFSESSPLANRIFLIAVIILLSLLAVFLLSRGIKMPKL